MLITGFYLQQQGDHFIITGVESMTTEERLREAARYLRTQHPRPISCGLYIDELMLRAAQEMDDRARTLASIVQNRKDADALAVKRMLESPMSGKG